MQSNHLMSIYVFPGYDMLLLVNHTENLIYLMLYKWCM